MIVANLTYSPRSDDTKERILLETDLNKTMDHMRILDFEPLD